MELNRTSSEVQVAIETAGYGFLFVLAISGNLLVSCTLLRRGQLDTPSNRLVFSLTSSHSLLLILLVPGVFMSVWRSSGFFSETWCTASAFVTVLILVAGSLTLASISVDRFIAIVYPMKYGTVVTSTRVVGLLSVVWVVGAVCAILPLVGVTRFHHREGMHTCWISWTSSYLYTGIILTISVLLPLLTMLGAYLRILRIARKKCKKIIVGAFTSPPKTILTERKYSNVGDMYHPLDHVAELGKTCSNDGSGRSIEGLMREGQNSHSSSLSFAITQDISNDHTDELFKQLTLRKYYESQATDGIVNPLKTDLSAEVFFSQPDAAKPNPPVRMNSIGEKVCDPERDRPSIGRLSQLRHKLSMTGSMRKASWGTVVTHSSPTKGIWTIFFVFGGFFLTWTTLVVTALWEVFSSSKDVPYALESISLATIIAGSATHPVLYGLYDRSIRKHLKILFCVRRNNRCQSFRRGSAKWSDTSDCTYSRHSRDGSGFGFNKNATSLSSVPSTNNGFGCTPRESTNSVVRKPSQDSGAVLPSDTDEHSDSGDRKQKFPRKYNRRMSAPPELILQSRQKDHTQSLLSRLDERIQHI